MGTFSSFSGSMCVPRHPVHDTCLHRDHLRVPYSTQWGFHCLQFLYMYSPLSWSLPPCMVHFRQNSGLVQWATLPRIQSRVRRRSASNSNFPWEVDLLTSFTERCRLFSATRRPQVFLLSKVNSLGHRFPWSLNIAFLGRAGRAVNFKIFQMPHDLPRDVRSILFDYSDYVL